MITGPDLETNNPDVRLVQPDVERDGQLGVDWLNSEVGQTTLLLMGNTPAQVEKILPTNLEAEKARVQDFIDGTNQLNWMIECDDKVLGSIWVDLHKSEIDVTGGGKATVKAPAIHIMIGDPDVRGKGVGKEVTRAVINYLKDRGDSTVYSRHLANNDAARKLMELFSFQPDGEQYTDSDTLTWQNVVNYLYLNPDIEVKASSIEGKGLFAKKFFNKGDQLSIVTKSAPDTSVAMTAIEFTAFRDKCFRDEKNWDSVMLADGTYRVGTVSRDEDPSNFGNHSCDPNTAPLNNRLVVLRKVKPGDEITIDYAQFSPKTWSMECSCNSPNCRNTVIGRL